MNVALNLEEKNHTFYSLNLFIWRISFPTLCEEKKNEDKISSPIQMSLNIMFLKVLFNVFI